MTGNRLVDSIDTALDLGNYDPFDLPDNNFETVTGYLGPKSKDTTQKVLWTNEPHTHVGRHRSCDIVTGGVSSVRNNTKHCKSIRDAFELFMTDDMITLIVHKSNLKIDAIIEQLPEKIKINSKYTYMSQTDNVEMYALFGLMYFRGLLGLNNHRYSILFSEKAGPAVFGATMSRDRFKFLVSNIMFDDQNEREMNWPQDTLTCLIVRGGGKLRFLKKNHTRFNLLGPPQSMIFSRNTNPPNLLTPPTPYPHTIY